MKESFMLLAIDIGNTNTHAAIFQKNKILAELRFASHRERTPDEVWLYLKSFFDGKTISVKQIEGVVISSVVPAITEAYSQASKLHIHHTPVVVSGILDIGMAIQYDDPATLGADRICAAIAAFQRYGGPSIIIDFGTATTFDAVSKKGEFLGGVIAPGIQTAATELFRKTSQLTTVPLQFPPNVLGNNTVACMQSGILFGAVEATDGMIRRIKRVVGKHAIVVATGGFASLMSELSHEIKYIQPTLVLEGARLIFEHSRRKKK